MPSVTLRAYSCTVVGTDWERVVHAVTASKAKYLYWLDVKDAWPDVPITDMRARSLGLPRTTERFHHTATYRKAWFRLGDKVRVNNSIGFVADSDSSANFVVHFISGEWANRILHVHVSEIHPAQTEEGVTPCHSPQSQSAPCS